MLFVLPASLPWQEMVEAMGGQDSPWYGQFRMYACEAYNILRKV